MANRSSRYEPRDDPPRVSRRANPDRSSGVNDGAYEYIRPDAFPDPPSHTFEAGQRPRQRSPPRRQGSGRASTLPPKSSRSSPPGLGRRVSPSVHTRHSDSPPRRRHARRDVSPRAPRSAPATAAAAAAAAADPGSSRQAKPRFVDRPAFKNMKTYGQKGLSTLGELMDAYAAAQAPPMQRGRPRGGRHSYDDYYDDDDDYYNDRYDRSRRRRHHARTPSPSPPRRGAAKRSERARSTTHGRHRSPTPSPTTRSRGYESDGGRGRHRHRRSGRDADSLSPSPPRRRGRSHTHQQGSTVPKKPSRHRSSMDSYKKELRSPDPDVAHRWQLAARAALEAGGLTAFRLRKEPGSWTGAKGAKVATAALGAAAIDAFVDKDPRHHRPSGMKGMAESVVGGLLASKLTGVPSATTRKGRPRY